MYQISVFFVSDNGSEEGGGPLERDSNPSGKANENRNCARHAIANRRLFILFSCAGFVRFAREI